MATNPFKHPPPTSSTSENCSTYEDYDEQAALRLSSASATPAGSSVPSTPDSSSILKQRAPCACSNISIMQLFHEMKQKYPTVPDTVVSELVTQNCHDRPACVSKLEEAVLGTPAQTTYPAQSIHSGSLKRRSAEQRSRQSAGSRQDGNGFSNSNSSSNSSTSSRESSVDSSRLRGTVNEGPQFVVNSVGPSGGCGGVGVHDRLAGDGRVPTIPHRPTTLAFGTSSSTMGYAGGGVGGSGIPPPPPTRPHRTAPACPPNGSLATSTITTTTTASSNADLGETVNLQVNVTVSPKAGGPLHVGQRHTSTISLQPEPPYSRELAQVSSTFNSGVVPAPAGLGQGAGPSQGPSSGGVAGGAGSNGNAVGAGGGGGGRSSTSVNLTLRQPTDGRPHSPIHIHASPLKYTAKNFNAQAGIQSKLEVTFRDGFGSFSAMRAHVPGYESYQGTHRPVDTQTTSLNTLQYQQQQQQQQLQEPLFEQQASYRYQSPGTAMPSHFQTPLSSSSPLPSVVHRVQTSRGLMGALRGGSLFASGGQLENDGLTKEMRYQNFVVAEMAVSQQLEQKQRLSREVERKQIQFESICREIFVLQQPLRYIDAELLDREVLLLAAEVEQLQKEVDSCDDEEARAAAAIGSSITDGLSALSVEGGSPMLPSGASNAAVVNRPPRPPRPPPPRATTQSPSRTSSGSITPGTPLLASVPFGGGSPGTAHTSSSGSSPCSTSSSINGVGNGDPTSTRLHAPGSSSNIAGGDEQAAASGSNQPWICTLCTFQNHELMTSCELCTLPKASGSRTQLPENAQRLGLAVATTSNAVSGTDVCDGGGGGGVPVGVALLRRQHLSVDTGVAAAAAAAAVVGASVGSSTAPPYPGGCEMPPPSFASLSCPSSSPSLTLPITSQTAQQPGQQHPTQQQQQQQQPNPPPLQNAQYQKSSIEC